ncbi:hypothetical protein ACFX2F_023554 [Malus domestica]
MSLILNDVDLMAWTVEDLILSRSNSEVLEFRSCSELDDRWRSAAKALNIYPLNLRVMIMIVESIGRSWLIPQTFLHSVSMPVRLTSLW